MTTWGFIPAREHSTRFPHKNSAPFLGEPLVVRAVRMAEEAQRLGLIDRIIVLTDRWGEVEQALRDAGVRSGDRLLVARRPAPLADDPKVRVIDLLRHCLREAAANDGSLVPMQWPAPDAVCVLLPTSPLRTVRHLVESYRLLMPEVDVVLSVTPFRQDPGYALEDKQGQLILRDELRGTDRLLKHCGTVIWVRASHILGGGGFYSGNVRGYFIPPEDACDVDTKLELEWGSFLVARKGGVGN
mgnify:CR=1 FL=1